MKVFLLVPTYNEAKNLERLIVNITNQNINDLQVVIIDDNSPDGTGRIADQIAASKQNIQVIHRPEKAGLGPAYLAGFSFAIQQGADLIMQMDADFSHDPRDIQRLIEASHQADVVIGSRYITGGGVNNWDWKRRAISKFGNFYARVVLGLGIRDLTAGYVLYRRQVLERLDLKTISSVGYNFQIEMKFKAVRAGFNILEIPIIFSERQGDKSKFSISIIIESFLKVFLLRFKK